MKKTIASAILLVLFMSIFNVVYAANPNITINTTGGELAQETKKVTIIVSIGEFTEIPENPVIECQAQLEYDKEVFSDIKVEGLNSWSADYVEPNINIGNASATAAANMEIAKITLTLNENTTKKSTVVKIKEGIISAEAASNLDFEFEGSFGKDIPITIVEEEQEQGQEQEQEPNTKENETTPQNTAENQSTDNNETKNTSNTSETEKKATNNNDNTTASTKLPKTGMGKIALIVVILVITGGACLVKYKSIKIK